MSEGHTPVLLEEMLQAISPRSGAHYIDGTFGGGYYTKALLERAQCNLLAIDRDPEAIQRGSSLRNRFPNRLSLVHGRFSQMGRILAEQGQTACDGVVLDLGVSSFQLDQSDRGFSFRADGPLDMRMEISGTSAADFVNSAPETDIADVIARFGEERHAKRIAHAIVAARPLSRTRELAAVVEEALGSAAKRQKIHPATRTFQALRLYVNDELSELQQGLLAAERVLRPRGRLALISFHSLEDRLVKRFLAARSGRVSAGSRHVPERRGTPAPTFTLLPTRTPRHSEVARNPRSRSARLRAAERTSAPVAAQEARR
jgi:16S rRNA (cytosine1402-N4)-methyltransferase